MCTSTPSISQTVTQVEVFLYNICVVCVFERSFKRHCQCCDGNRTGTLNCGFLSQPWRTETEVFWKQVNMVSPSDVCFYIWYIANELVQVRRLKVSSKSSAPLNFCI